MRRWLGVILRKLCMAGRLRERCLWLSEKTPDQRACPAGEIACQTPWARVSGVWSSENTSRARSGWWGVLRGGNAGCGVATRVAWTLAACTVLGGGPGVAWGQAGGLGQAGEVGAGVGESGPASPAEAMRAFRMARSWVDGWRVPEAGEAAAGPFASGVRVELRLGGRVIGRGESLGVPIGTSASLREAVAEALAEAERRLPITRDGFYEAKRSEAASRMAMSVEFAGAMTPMEVGSRRELSLTLSPGLEGVAVRVGDRVAAAFPGEMLVTGREAGAAVGGLVARVTEDAQLALVPIDELRTRHGVVVYRFGATHLVEVAPGGGAGGGVGGERLATFVHRGGRVVDARELTTAGLGAWASRLAVHLVERLERSERARALGFPGELDPLTGRLGSASAGPIEQGLAILALRRVAESAWADASLRARADRAADVAARALAEVVRGEVEPWGSAELAAAGSLAMSGVDEPAVVAARERCAAVVRAVDDAWDVRAGGRGLVALALARAGEPGAEAFLRSVYAASMGGELVREMPQLAEAELLVAGDGERVPAAGALREWRALAGAHQLSGSDVVGGGGGGGGGDRDLEGGVVFTRGVQPLPTWQTARVVSAWAQMLGDARLTDDGEVPAELVRVVRSARFLVQLTAGPAVWWMYPDEVVGEAVGGGARWGVRRALWDQRMGVEATAMALLAGCDVLDAAGAIVERQRAASVGGLEDAESGAGSGGG